MQKLMGLVRRCVDDYNMIEGGTPLRWDDALKPLDWRSLPSVGEPEPTPLKNNNN